MAISARINELIDTQGLERMPFWGEGKALSLCRGQEGGGNETERECRARAVRWGGKAQVDEEGRGMEEQARTRGSIEPRPATSIVACATPFSLDSALLLCPSTDLSPPPSVCYLGICALAFLAVCYHTLEKCRSPTCLHSFTPYLPLLLVVHCQKSPNST
eukprot:830926-Rhodomonas_salina.2